MKRFLGLAFVLTAITSSTDAQSAACNPVHYAACNGLFPGTFLQAQEALRAAKNAGHGVLHDQGACEEVGRDAGRLAGQIVGGAISDNLVGAVAGAIVGGGCGECLCREIY